MRMIKTEYTLMLVWTFFGCQAKIDNQVQVDKQENQPKEVYKAAIKDSLQIIEDEVAMIDRQANKRKATEYGGGDVYGVKTYYFNEDSTLLKVMNESSSGDYGFAKEQYYLKEGRLLYSEKVSAQIDFGEEGSRSTYDIHHQKNYFIRVDKGLRLAQEKVAQQKYDTIFDKESVRRSFLKQIEYEKELTLLKEIADYQLLDED